MSKRDELLNWCRLMKVFSTVNIDNWGKSHNFYRCADRRVREFMNDPKINIERIPDKEAMLRGLNKKGQSRIAWFEVV